MDYILWILILQSLSHSLPLLVFATRSIVWNGRTCLKSSQWCCESSGGYTLWPRVKMLCHPLHAKWTVTIILWGHDVFQPSGQAKHSYQRYLTRTKQISSELVCGNSFVKILCTYFFCIYLVLQSPTFPPGNIAVFRKVLIRLSSIFVRTSSLPTVASGTNFKGIERDFLVPAGKTVKIVSLEHRWALQVAEIVFRCNHGSASSAMKHKLRHHLL